MDDATIRTAGIRQAVPLLNVADMAASLAFYVDGLGGRMTRQWVDDGVLRWAWIELGEAAVMIQQVWREGPHAWNARGPVGEGMTLCYFCDDAVAIWRHARARGLEPKRPFVGNRLWVASFTDPDGYRLDFESPADAPEESEYEGD